MKLKKLFLDQEEEESLNVGLIRLAKSIPDYEFFFQINHLNFFQFYRKDDFIIPAEYNNYHFSCYHAYDEISKNCWRVFSNKSTETLKKKEQDKLFLDEQDIKFLLEHHQEVDYIITSGDDFVDFSLILLPENLSFPIQDFSLEPDEELYQIIQYYE